MQDISGTSLAASRTANRPSCIKLEVYWNAATGWSDESARIITANGNMQAIKRSEGIVGVGGGIADIANITLDNHDRRFSPWYSGGALYSYIGSNQWKGLETRLSLGYEDAGGTPEYVPVHRGYIDDIITFWSSAGQRAQLKLSDKTSYLKHKGKSILYNNYRTDQLMTVFVNLLPQTPIDIRPTLVKDIGLFSIPWGWIDDENIWKELSLLAEAEGGRLYFSNTADNTLIFENATHFLTGSDHTSPSVATFAISDYSSAGASLNYSNYWNHVIVEYTPYKRGPLQEVWSQQEVLRIKPGETETVKALFNAPVYSLEGQVKNKDYIAVTAGGTRRSEDVTLTVTSYAQQGSIDVENTGDYTLFMVRNRLRGRPIYAGDTEKAEAKSTGSLIDQAGEVTKTITANHFIQTREHAQALADFLLERGHEPRSAPPIKDIDGMPWLQVGDRVTLTEEGGTSVGDFFVQQIPWSWSPSRGMSMSPVCLPAGLFAYDNYFVLGTNTLGSGSATPGRAFY